MTHRHYTIVVERAEGNYSAYAPDLPGVELRASGESIPEPTSVARTVEVVA